MLRNLSLYISLILETIVVQAGLQHGHPMCSRSAYKLTLNTPQSIFLQMYL